MTCINRKWIAIVYPVHFLPQNSYESLNPIETRYANTDLDLRSPVAFDQLHGELSLACCQLQYAEYPEGTWSASYEANRLNDSATNDILALIDVITGLSESAKQQLSNCDIRDFNIGIHCWDTWTYRLTLPPKVIAAMAAVNCTVSVTLYPMRNPDGTAKFEEDDG